MISSAALLPLWATCVDRLKDRVNNRTFWEALEHTVPVAVEDNVLIIGLNAEDFNYASYILQQTTLHIVKEEVARVFTQPYDVRIIEGTTPADWEAAKASDATLLEIKKREAALSQVSSVASSRSASEGSSNWDNLGDSIARYYETVPHHGLPQGKAQFLNEALYQLAEGMSTLYPENPDEATERALARTIERVARFADVTPTMLAFELMRTRAYLQSAS